MRVPGQRGTTEVRLERLGRVVECRGEAVVRFSDGCAACGCCRVSRSDRQIPLAWLQGAEGLRQGDSLTLSVPVGALTRVSALVFGVPLGALLLGGWLGRLAGSYLGPGAEVAGGITGLAGLVLAWAIVAGRAGAVTEMLKLEAGREAQRQRMDS